MEGAVRGVLGFLVGLGGVALLAVLVVNFIVMPTLVRHRAAVRVPEITGLEVAAARHACDSAGLQLVEEGKRHGQGVPPGRVLSQSPAAASSVKPGRSVRVMVSLGTEVVTMPDVRGLTLRQATLQIENAQLLLGEIARIHDGTGGEVVRATRPAAGIAIARGDSVTLLLEVGAERESFLMPNLIGQDIADARALIESRGFRVGRVTYRAATGVYPGTVLEQYPDSGALVHGGDAIDLVAATPD
jgi:serine/threonine-protein kinase